MSTTRHAFALRLVSAVVVAVGFLAIAPGHLASGVHAAADTPPGSWSLVSSPNAPSSASDQFNGVTCPATDDCWAVGQAAFNGTTQPLIEHWDGSAWTVSDAVAPTGSQENDLYAVACFGGADCWAVGLTYAGSVDQTLTEQWTGSQWAIVESANVSTSSADLLSSVTCVDASDCWAVGQEFPANSSDAQTLTENWNGSAWNVVPSADDNEVVAGVTVQMDTNILESVTCVNANDCWAAGYDYPKGQFQTLIEQWNGTTWTISTSVDGSTTEENILYGIDCISADDCWAAGYYYNGSSYVTLIQQWNGTSWNQVMSPNPSTSENVLQGITCDSDADCWAVGSAPPTNNAALSTLTEEYTTAAPAETPDLTWPAAGLTVMWLVALALRRQIMHSTSDNHSDGDVAKW